MPSLYRIELSLNGNLFGWTAYADRKTLRVVGMAYVTLKGGKIRGELSLQGSKNAALPILAASVLCRGEVKLTHCPDITDVRDMLSILSCFRVPWSFSGGELLLDPAKAQQKKVPAELMKKTRGGILFLGALLGRFSEAELSTPGGCSIGKRPINFHLELLRSMGVQVTEQEELSAKGRPAGAEFTLPYASVGATENAILAAVCADGVTVIRRAAKEPEILELCAFLRKAGAKIENEGLGQITVEGVPALHGAEHRLSGDRIAAGTYLTAAMMTGGSLTLFDPGGISIPEMLPTFSKTGMLLEKTKETIILRESHEIKPVGEMTTAPFPAFPTDMQSQMLSYLSLASGDSSVTETVFESRFAVLPELNQMGAFLTLTEKGVYVRGSCRFRGTTVYAKDLRGGAALLLAGLAAEDETTVYGFEYIARGYENICQTLTSLGASAILKEEKT